MQDERVNLILFYESSEVDEGKLRNLYDVHNSAIGVVVGGAGAVFRCFDAGRVYGGSWICVVMVEGFFNQYQLGATFVCGVEFLKIRSTMLTAFAIPSIEKYD